MTLQYILDNTDNQAVIDYITNNPVEAQKKLDKIIKQIGPMLEIECMDIYCGSCDSCQNCSCDDPCNKEECPMPEEIYMLYEFLFESQVSGCNDCNDDRIQSQKIDDVTIQYFEQKDKRTSLLGIQLQEPYLSYFNIYKKKFNGNYKL